MESEVVAGLSLLNSGVGSGELEELDDVGQLQGRLDNAGAQVLQNRLLSTRVVTAQLHPLHHLFIQDQFLFRRVLKPIGNINM